MLLIRLVIIFVWCFFSFTALCEHKGQDADSSAIFPFPLTQNMDYADYIFQADGVFTSEECDKIIEYGRSLEVTSGQTGHNEEVSNDDSVRKSKVSWIGWNQETDWIFQRLFDWSVKINNQFYQFDLTGFFEKIQFTEYEAPDGHYTWHSDGGAKEFSNRKLSIVVQLSDPKKYEGGELQFFTGSEVSIEKKKGGTTFFPSYMQHRVTPITKGKRYSLVIWVSGPPFR